MSLSAASLDFRRDGLALGIRDIAEHDLGAFGSEGFRLGRPLPFGAAADERDLILQTSHDPIPF
jgi:hypothetical protein